MKYIFNQVVLFVSFISFLGLAYIVISLIIMFTLTDEKIPPLWFFLLAFFSLAMYILTSKYLDARIQFGKYKGSKWKSLPDDYLSWIVRNHKNKYVVKQAQSIIDLYKPKELTKDELEIIKQYGDDFEREVGNYYEAQGYTVEYRGLELGFKDGGIDLIATKPDELILIQCKYWKKKNSITPNMVKEFYGSCHFYLNKTENIISPTCIYAVTTKDAISFAAYQLFKENYVKCRYQVF